MKDVLKEIWQIGFYPHRNDEGSVGIQRRGMGGGGGEGLMDNGLHMSA